LVVNQGIKTGKCANRNWCAVRQCAPHKSRAVYDRLGSCMDGARGAREKNLTFSRNDTGAVMYPASKVQPFWLRALM